MSGETVVLASALYWGIYIIGVVVALPCALALLFGIVQTARWFLRGGVNHLPGRHTSMTRREKALLKKGEVPLNPSEGDIGQRRSSRGWQEHFTKGLAG